MARQKKPKQNILIEFVAWIFKWILKIILFLAILGGLLYGGYYLKQEYDKSKILKDEAKRLKARDCLAKEIPVLEQEIYKFRDSIDPNSNLKEVVDIVFYEDIGVSIERSGYRIKEASNRQGIPEKDKKRLLEFYEKYEKSRYEDIQVTDYDLKRNVLVYSIKTECDSDFNFLINIDDNQDRSLDRFRVWANNSPKGYEEGNLKKFYRNFSKEVTQKSIEERNKKNKKIQEKKRKKKEKIDARNRIKREHEALQERDRQERQSDPRRLCEDQRFFYIDPNGNKYCRHKDTGEKIFINLEKNRLEPTGRFREKVITYQPKEKGGYDPNKGTSDTGISDKGPVHQF
jgi:hypothetical protein